MRCSKDCRACGNPNQEPFRAGQFLGGRVGVFICCGENLIQNIGVENIRHKSGADALDFMRAGLSLADDRGRSGFHPDDPDAGIVGFQSFACAGDCSAGPNARNKEVDFPIGILPDFLGGGRPMCSGVCRVGKLAGDKGIRDFLGQLFRLCNGPLHACRAFGEDQLRAKGGDQPAAFQAHGLRHGQDQPVTP